MSGAVTIVRGALDQACICWSLRCTQQFDWSPMTGIDLNTMAQQTCNVDLHKEALSASNQLKAG